MDNQTKLQNLIDPEVMAGMISAKLPTAIIATPFAKVDNTLVGQPGSTITVPKYEYIGDAEDVAEGIDAGIVKLETGTAKYTVKKVMKDVILTDEAVLSGYGNPVGETNSQLVKSIASKVDQEIIDELQKATLIKDNGKAISYDGIVDSIDLFQEEVNTDKVMFIAPSQVTTLRKDANFISADKYNNNVIMTGEIGKVANARIVPSRKIKAVEGKYSCPIVQLTNEPQTQDETAAITIYMKSSVNVETERHTRNRTTEISADQHYVVALTDESKVVVAQFTE